MLEQLSRLHRCTDCPIRCQAVKHPLSVFARIHRWHHTWWPGWKLYQRRLRTVRMTQILETNTAVAA
jgi:hypothetical protein